jgi:hypothetical protein
MQPWLSHQSFACENGSNARFTGKLRTSSCLATHVVNSVKKQANYIKFNYIILNFHIFVVVESPFQEATSRSPML